MNLTGLKRLIEQKAIGNPSGIPNSNVITNIIKENTNPLAKNSKPNILPARKISPAKYK